MSTSNSYTNHGMGFDLEESGIQIWQEMIYTRGSRF